MEELFSRLSPLGQDLVLLGGAVLVLVIIIVLGSTVLSVCRYPTHKQVSHLAKKLGFRYAGKHADQARWTLRKGDIDVSIHFVAAKRDTSATLSLNLKPTEPAGRRMAQDATQKTAHPDSAPAGDGEVLDIGRIRPVVLREETWRDRLGVWLRINREVRTGDDVFDRAVYVDSTAPDDVVARLLASPDVRRTVLEVLRSGWRQVVLAGKDGHLSLRTWGCKSHAGSPRFIGDSMAKASRLLSRLPSLVYHVGYPETDTWAVAAKVVSVLAVLAVLGLMGASRWWNMLDTDIYRDTMSVGLEIWAVSLPVLVLLIRGHSSSLRNFVKIEVALVFCLTAGTTAAAIVVDAGLDMGTGTTRTYRVDQLGMHRWHHVDSDTDTTTTSCWIRFKPWNDRADTVEVHVSEETFQELEAESTDQRFVTLKIHDGLLGYRWCNDIRPAPSAPQR